MPEIDARGRFKDRCQRMVSEIIAKDRCQRQVTETGAKDRSQR